MGSIVMQHVPKVLFVGGLPGDMIRTCIAIAKCYGRLRCIHV